MLLLLLAACLEPFPTDRHDLVDLRIVGMRADADGTLAAYVWEGTEAWSAAAPTREWGGDARCAVDCRLQAPGTATLTVTGGDGATESGELAWGSAAGTPDWERLSIDLDDDVATVQLQVPGAERVRWMAPAGELEEIAPDTAEFVVPGDGIWPLVALWLDGQGGNGWTTVDVVAGVEGPFLLVGTRRFPLAARLPEGPVTVLATVVEADTPAGFGLTNVLVDDGSVLPDVCGEYDNLWDPDSIAERRCGRDELLGQRVRVVGEVVP